MTQGRYALYDPEDIPEDIQDEALPSPPPGYEGGWLTPLQLRRRNRELAKVGLRICTAHQGVALPLTEEFFYIKDRAKGYLKSRCKACHNHHTAERNRARYQHDPAYVAARSVATRLYHRKHRAKRLEAKRAYTRRRKLARFAALLGSNLRPGATP